MSRRTVGATFTAEPELIVNGTARVPPVGGMIAAFTVTVTFAGVLPEETLMLTPLCGLEIEKSVALPPGSLTVNEVVSALRVQKLDCTSTSSCDVVSRGYLVNSPTGSTV